MELQTPSYRLESDSKRFFVNINAGTDDETTVPVRFNRNTLILTSQYGTRVAFSKTNRSKMFRDSREPKKLIPDYEVKQELQRILINPVLANQAFAELIG